MGTLNRLPMALGLVALFLAPVLGGQVYLGAAQPLLEGGLGDLRGPALAFTAQAIVVLFLIAGIAVTLSQRKVIQLPAPKLAVSLMLFAFLIGFSTPFSGFRWVAWSHWMGWIAYVAATFGMIAVLGRGKGPVAAVSTLVAGCSLIAIEGILEYGSMRATDPTWRVFGSWVNPNAFAGMLLIGWVLALSLVATVEDRLHKLLAGSGAVLIGFALLLTQSRGGFAAALVGLVAFAVMLAVGRAPKKLIPALAPLLLTVLLAFGLQQSVATSSASGPNPTTALGRVGDVQSTQEQSAGFRQLLWQGAVKMVRQQPFGYGLGSYRFESGRSGLTPQTQFTHQGFLQVAVESGLAGLAAFLALGGLWFVVALKGFRSLESDRITLLSGVVAAIVACGAHNLFDSDWQHFGIGFAFFALLGIGLQLAADGSMPEYLSKPTRAWALGSSCALLALAHLHLASVEMAKARSATALLRGDAPAAAAAARQAISLAPSDADAHTLLSSSDPSQVMESLQAAARFAPSTRNLRRLARFQLESGQGASAESTLRQALTRDPNNLPTLLLLAELSANSGEVEQLRGWVDRMVSIEATPYFRVRALPELIPTETYEARLLLADRTSDPVEAATLRAEALKGLAEYVRITGPRIKRMAAANQDFAGESLQDLERKRALGLDAVSKLREGQRATPEVEELATVLSDGG